MDYLSNEEKPIITIQDITIRIRDKFILPQTSWEILTGQHWAILGPNGAGKSSLVRVLIGDLPYVRGSITYHFPNRPVEIIGYVSSELQEHLIAREESQDGARYFARKLNDFEKARSTILAGDHEEGGGHPELERIVDLLGIRYLLDRNIRSLSTGEMRKVLIARALIKSPAILILDEPFAGIDVDSRERLKESIGVLMRQGMQLILVTHREEEILPGISHVLCVKKGRVFLQGKRHDILTREQMGRLYDEKKIISFPPVRRSVSDGINSSSQNQEILVEMKGVAVKYGDVQIIDHLNWMLKRGENWAIVGPNGSGKTTLLSLIAGDHPQAYANEIYLFGKRRGSGESIWDVKARIGMISSEFQARYRNEIMTYDVVASGLFDSVGLYRKLTTQQHQRVHRWIQFFGLLPIADRTFTQLSYGEKRMALLARSMVKSPDLLILDEPCQGLDQENRRRVLDMIEKIGARTDTNLLYVTHYQDEIPKCIHHVLTLRRPHKSR